MGHTGLQAIYRLLLREGNGPVLRLNASPYLNYDAWPYQLILYSENVFTIRVSSKCLQPDVISSAPHYVIGHSLTASSRCHLFPQQLFYWNQPAHLHRSCPCIEKPLNYHSCEVNTACYCKFSNKGASPNKAGWGQITLLPFYPCFG